MFFHYFLLQPQHKMQLSLPWLAATVGVKKIKKEDVIKCDIIKVCDQIEIFVTSDSLNPNKRFSLRLSAILMHGACRILRQQVIFLKDDIDRSLLDREKAADRLIFVLTGVDTPLTPQPAIKKRKPKQKQEESPESLLERIRPVRTRGPREVAAEPEFSLEPLQLPEESAEVPILQSRITDITLREEVERPKEMLLTDDFGPVEEIIEPLPSTSRQEIVVADIHFPPEIRKEKEKAKEATVEEELVHQPEVSPQDLIRAEQNVPHIHVEEESVIQVIPEIEVIPAEPRPPTQKPSDITQINVIEPVVEPEAPRRKGGRNIAAFLLLKTKQKKFVFINQDMQIYKDEPKFVPITKIIPDFVPMDKFYPDWQTAPSKVEAVRPAKDTLSTRESGSLRLGIDGTAETPDISAPSAQQIETPSQVTSPVPGYVSTPRKRPFQGSSDTVEEVLPPAANGDMGPPEMLPTKRMKVVSIEEVQAYEQPPKEGIPEDEILIAQEEPEMQPLAVSDASELPRRPAEEAHQTIVGRDDEGDIMLRRSSEIMQVINQRNERIGPAELCKATNKRLTKLNMSILFATLLTLAKGRHVLLHSEEDSSELKWIEKGPVEYK